MDTRLWYEMTASEWLMFWAAKLQREYPDRGGEAYSEVCDLAMRLAVTND
jgi:hypothetical protein